MGDFARPDRAGRFVLTGGPHSGKTTLLRELARRGFTVAPEAAIRVIERIQRERGVLAGRTWRYRNVAEFQLRIAREQEIIEARLPPPGSGIAFLDRGLPDGLAYCRHHGVQPPVDLVRLARGRCYGGAFLLEVVLPFDPRRASGRGSDEADARAIEPLFEQVYAELGIPLRRVPLMPVERRADLVVELVGG